jgi:F0F1-type ATP synthase membrane subunit b/b'
MPYGSNRIRLEQMSPQFILTRLKKRRAELAAEEDAVRAEMAAIRAERDQQVKQRQADLRIRRRHACRDAVADLCAQIKALQDHADRQIEDAHSALREIVADQRYVDSELESYRRQLSDSTQMGIRAGWSPS